MSLRSKLEAVIYAAEEPVTLTQLATLFGADALEWKAEQEAAAAEQTAEVAGEMERPPEAQTDALPLIDESVPEPTQAEADLAPAEPSVSAEAPASETAAAEAEPAADDPEAEARRQARQRERDVKAVLKQLLDELIAVYASDDHGVEIREIAGGYRMATKPECHDAVRLFVKSLKPPLKLSLPALETLAVVAYKQPVTAPEVSEIRGVESAGVLASLMSRKLIATAGRKQVIGRPILYKTTKEFLLRFGLKDLSELPSMEEFEKMAAAEIEEEMEPEAAAADAAESAAEAEAERAENLPSGEDTPAEESEQGESAAPASEETQQRASMEESPAEMAAEASPSSNQEQSATAENAGAPATDAMPAENEAEPHAEEEQEEHRP
ncbi:MAG: SMC-Scp complex subunit ScpB [Acidobacteriota bacterium]